MNITTTSSFKNTMLFITMSGLGLIGTAAFAQQHDMSSMSNMAAESDTTVSQNTEQSIISTSGIVKLIDLANKKLTIEHEAIPSVNWPAMTMRFTFEDSAILGNIKEGSKINFDFTQQGNLSVLQKITLIP